MEFKAELCLTQIFNAYLKNPELLTVLENPEAMTLEKRVCDYVAGMTDRYAMNEYQKLFVPHERD
jgi:dGTPase